MQPFQRRINQLHSREESVWESRRTAELLQHKLSNHVHIRNTRLIIRAESMEQGC